MSAVGLGCWAIGGPFWDRGGWMGYGDVDDAASSRALAHALDYGIELLDVADVYGCGHAERLVGKAIAGRRDRVVLVGKCGWAFDEGSRRVLERDVRPASIERACEASLRRLGTDVIDLYVLHPFEVSLEEALLLRDTFETLVTAGKIRGYGWCSEDPALLRAFADGAKHLMVSPQQLNLFFEAPALLALADELELAVVTRRPLGMGLLTGKLGAASTFADNDMRRRFGWDLASGKQAAQLATLERLRAVLTRRGHTLAQAALAWIWARSERAVPVPGFKSVSQVDENMRALEKGPLDATQLEDITALLQTTAPPLPARP